MARKQRATRGATGRDNPHTHAPVTDFLPPGRKFYHLPIIYSNF
jgi:hypothetical protein